MIEVRLLEWERRGAEHPELRGLSLKTDAGRALAAKLGRAGVLEISELREGLRIAARAHVGRIQVDDLVVTIEPKVGRGELLALLRYAYSLRDVTLFERTQFSVGGLLEDLLVVQLVAEVTELLGRGLVRRYVAREEALTVPRGRIDVPEFVRRFPMTDARLPCRYAERSTDHGLNRVLKAGLAMAASTARDASLRGSLKALARRVGEDVSEPRVTTELLDDAARRLDRQTSPYASAIDLIRLLHDGSALSLDGDGSTTVRGFLFDMNRFFQALLGRFLTENLVDHEVHSERGLTDMMRYVPGLNPRHRHAPRPRPDFMVVQGKSIVAILDAKYRDLWDRELPREMLYQLAIYALSQAGGMTATILYPTAIAHATDAIIEIRDPSGRNARGRVVLRPVVLGKLVGAVSADRAARARHSRELVFGAGRTEPIIAQITT